MATAGRPASAPPRSRPASSPNREAPGAFRTLTRAFRVLDLLAHGPLSVGDAGRALAVNKSTASRLLAAVAAHGYAVRDTASGTYRLGPRIGELYASYVAGRRLAPEAFALLERVAARTGETVLLTAFESGSAVYIDKVESGHPLRTSSRIGERAPLHAGAAGKAILAVLSPTDAERLLGEMPLEQFTSRTQTDPRRVIDELAAVRRRGYAVSVEEINEGVIGVGVALPGPDGRPLGAISVTGPRSRFTDRRIREVADALLAAREEWQPTTSDGSRPPRRARG